MRDARTGAVLLFEGEVFGCDSLQGQRLDSDTEIAAELLRGYLLGGATFVKSIDGEFNLIVYEPVEARISAFTDHSGSCPLYYWLSDGQMLIGSEKKCLLAASSQARKLDPVGLLQPFVHQHNLNDRTLVEGLKRLEPATRLTYSPGRLSLTEYGRVAIPCSSRASSHELVKQWEHVLKAATAKRLVGKNRLLISLSAGQDSRAIACSIERSKRPLAARTWGHAASNEVRYAQEIARALAFDHYIENPFHYRLSDGLRPIVWRTDGETDFRNGLSLFTHSAMRSIADDVIGGWLGDISSGAHLRPFMLVPMARNKFIAKVFRWYVQHNFDDLRHVFTRDFLVRHWPEVKQAFFDSYAGFADLPNARAHESWDLHNRQARMTVSSMPVDSHLFGKVRPFFDKTYLEFTASIPIQWRIGQSLYKSLISAIGPEIRAIPNGNTNVRNFESPIANMAGYVRTLGDKVLGRIVSRIKSTSHKVGHDNVSAELARHNRNDTGLREVIESFMSSRYFDGSIFDREQIARMLAHHYAGSSDHFELIAILASYAIALEYFVYERTTVCPQEARPVL